MGYTEGGRRRIAGQERKHSLYREMEETNNGYKVKRMIRHYAPIITAGPLSRERLEWLAQCASKVYIIPFEVLSGRENLGLVRVSKNNNNRVLVV